MSGSHLEELDLFYQDVRQANSRPLWMMGGDNLTTEPQPKALAIVWKWQDLRPLMYRAAQLIPVEQAERRVRVPAPNRRRDNSLGLVRAWRSSWY